MNTQEILQIRKKSIFEEIIKRSISKPKERISRLVIKGLNTISKNMQKLKD